MTHPVSSKPQEHSGQTPGQSLSAHASGKVNQTTAAGEANQYLTFNLSGEMYAAGILNVKEIIEYGSLTEIPMMPPFVRGVINLRGAVVPVIDLAARFGGKTAQIQRRTCIVIIEIAREDDNTHTQDIGILVDAVSEVIEIPPAEIEPPPAFGARIRTDFIAGMGKIHQRFVIILDIRRVLSVSEMATLADIGAATPPTGHEIGEPA